MKNYRVILTSLVNASRDFDSDRPETKNYYFDIDADSEEEAVYKAKEIHPLSVWESDCYEN